MVIVYDAASAFMTASDLVYYSIRARTDEKVSGIRSVNTAGLLFDYENSMKLIKGA